MPHIFLHPKDPAGNSAYGIRLANDEKIQRFDTYPSDDGTWRKCDPSWIGLEAGMIQTELIVRLAPLSSQ